MNRPRLSARRAASVVAAGAAMLLIAFVFDASPLFVPAVALLIVGAITPAWVWASARGAAAQRQLRADRVIEGEPLTATIVVRRGRLGLPGAEVVDPFTGARLELSGPLSPFTGDREAQVRVISRFPRRGSVSARPARVARHRPARARPRAGRGRRRGAVTARAAAHRAGAVAGQWSRTAL